MNSPFLRNLFKRLQILLQPANDPFGSDPFGGNSAFEENVLMPAKLETETEKAQPAKTEKSDVFGDLVAIGGNKKAATPKDMFAELATPEKKSLNKLRVEKSPSPKPVSPVGFQASETSSSTAPDPFGSTNNSFGTSDPFASDPFIGSNSGKKQLACHQSTQQDAFGVSAFSDDHNDDVFNIPLPLGPPPPLPESIASQTQITDPFCGPPPPPRPSVNTPPLPTHNPPLPPRPKSTSSESTKSSGSLNSLHESQTLNQQSTPPLPPRPKSNIETKVVPRPRPRASLLKNSAISLTSKQMENTQTEKAHIVQTTEAVISTGSDSYSDKVTNCVNSSDSDRYTEPHVTVNSSQPSAITEQTLQNESHATVNSNATKAVHRSSSAVADPFVSTDPFASEDPFTLSDPFANDPFASDPFTESGTTQPASQDDPFTCVIPSPRAKSDVDPFSVFDNTLSNDSSFKFERVSSKKSKAKVSGKCSKKHAYFLNFVLSYFFLNVPFY